MALTRAKLEELIAAGEIEVGGGGMQYAKPLGVSDANLITDFWVLGTNGASGGSNYPGDGYWYVNTVFYSNENQLKQTAYGYLSNEVWTRYRYQGTWHPWTNTALLSYPVGAIYMSYASTSPATLFGGTWTALGGRMLIGVNGTYTAGSTGGAATHSHGLAAGWAKIGVNANPYMFYKPIVKTSENFPAYVEGVRSVTGGGNDAITRVTALGGTTDSDSSLPPYLAVYMWRRTA